GRHGDGGRPAAPPGVLANHPTGLLPARLQPGAWRPGSPAGQRHRSFAAPLFRRDGALRRRHVRVLRVLCLPQRGVPLARRRAGRTWRRDPSDGNHFARLCRRAYPLANMCEYSSMLALVAVTVFLLMTLRWPVASLGGGVALFVVVMLMGIGYGLYQSPEPLVPALQSYWLKIHVSSMMASSGILVSSFVFAALYLVKDRSASVKSWLNGSGIAARLPSLETLDRLTFRAILLGFPIWTFGTMAGAVWGEHAWGRWWGWDPNG